MNVNWTGNWEHDQWNYFSNFARKITTSTADEIRVAIEEPEDQIEKLDKIPLRIDMTVRELKEIINTIPSSLNDKSVDFQCADTNIVYNLDKNGYCSNKNEITLFLNEK